MDIEAAKAEFAADVVESFAIALGSSRSGPCFSRPMEMTTRRMQGIFRQADAAEQAGLPQNMRQINTRAPIRHASE